MSLRTLLSSALLVSGAAASSSLVAKAAAGEVELCGTNEPSDDHKAFSQAMMERERVLLRQKEPFAVDVVYHVVMGTQAEADGISVSRASNISKQSYELMLNKSVCRMSSFPNRWTSSTLPTLLTESLSTSLRPPVPSMRDGHLAVASLP